MNLSSDHVRIESGRALEGQLSSFEHFRPSRSSKGLYGEDIAAGTTHFLTCPSFSCGVEFVSFMI